VRARRPDVEGFVEQDGVKVGYEVFGDRAPTLLLIPGWTIVHSHLWKLQVPYLADHYRVITFDRPGNGRSDRTVDRAAYTVEAVASTALAVLDATGTDRAVLVSFSQGSTESLKLHAEHPDRVLGAVHIGTALPMDPPGIAETAHGFGDPAPVDPDGWERLNAEYWLEHYDEFAGYFFSQCFPEPHSTKQREDCVGWAGETTPEVLLADAAKVMQPQPVEDWMARVSTPLLAIHGDDDRISPVGRSERLARETGGEIVVIEGSGHLPLARDPVRVNLVIRDFVDRLSGQAAPPTRWTRGRQRRRRALFISSPIGLGHARRDIAIVSELRGHHPDLEIEWLAQHPVTEMLEACGESVHPASARLANETAHLESESGEHRLHCFQAWRRMDEILLADFMVFHDLVAERDYDLVVGDEAWDVDYFLHENPELKRFAYCWLTDFVGWLPMPSGGAHEAELTADYNAEMIEQIARYPRVRDLSLFVGNPRDIVPDTFGAALPGIREWTEAHYDFPGYVTGFDPTGLVDRAELRDELGYGADEQVCIVTVGGSGVGGDLLARLIDAYPRAEARVPGLRMVVVAGPRIDPESLPAPAGVEVRSFVPALHRHLAASDLAVVQGGLTTCMELTATSRPFLYVPLRDHFEQNIHVHHRLQGHGAGQRVDFADAGDPDHLAELIATGLGRPVDYRPVEHDGAARAAAAIAELL
jgi:pimeloyl-ACP methyl ester carboxylesterase/predicted glycosyltransferase